MNPANPRRKYALLKGLPGDPEQDQYPRCPWMVTTTSTPKRCNKLLANGKLTRPWVLLCPRCKRGVSHSDMPDQLPKLLTNLAFYVRK